MKKTIEPEEKEVAIIKRNASSAMTRAQELVIVDAASLEGGIDFLSKIKQVSGQIKTTKEAITKPLNEALKNARALFSPMEEQLISAESLVKAKIRNYSDEVEKKAREEEAKLAARVEKGTLRPETAERKAAEIEKVENKVEAKTGSVTFSMLRKVRIVDETKIPRAYLVPDEVRIRKDALAGVVIPGVEVYEEKTVNALKR